MTDTERISHVEAWRESEMSMAAYCRERGLNYQTFRLWIKKFDDDTAPITESALVKLSLPNTLGPSDRSPLTIDIGPFQVRVFGGFDPAVLKDALKVCRDVAG